MTANPQIEDGHLDLANELVDKFCLLNLCAGEWRLLWAILRKTYGWHKKTDRITYSQFEKITAMNRWNIKRYLNRLLGRNIITKTGIGQRLAYGFQKDYSKWQPLSKQTTVTSRPLSKQTTVETVIQTDYAPLSKQTTKPLSKQTTTKENKETIKRNLSLSGKPEQKITAELLTEKEIDRLHSLYPEADLDYYLQVVIEDYKAKKEKIGSHFSLVNTYLKNEKGNYKKLPQPPKPSIGLRLGENIDPKRQPKTCPKCGELANPIIDKDGKRYYVCPYCGEQFD